MSKDTLQTGDIYITTFGNTTYIDTVDRPTIITTHYGVAKGIVNHIYFVDNSGNDTNNGLSEVTAWQTLSKVNGSSFVNEDIILFNRGDEWRGQITIPHDSISIAAYGSGAKPIINDSTIISGWETISPNKYKKVGVSNPYALLFINGVFGTQKSDSSSVTIQNDWYFEAGTNTLFVYTTDTTLIEGGSSMYGISCESHNNIKVSNIEVKKAGYHNFNIEDSNNITIDNCVFDNAGWQGISIYNSLYYTISNNIIRDNGNDGIYLNHDANYGDVYNNVMSGNGCGSDANGGDRQSIGMWFVKNVNIHDNTIVHTSPSSVLECSSTITRYYEDNINIYNNFITATIEDAAVFSIFAGDFDVYNNVVKITNTSNDSKFISTPEWSTNHTIIRAYNNTVTGVGIIFWDGTVDSYSGNSLFTFKNNIYNNVGFLYYYLGAGAASALTSDYNLFLDNTGNKFQAAELRYNIGGWQGLGYDANSIVGNPVFVGGSPYSYNLQSGSPAINTGVDVGLTTDILGNPIVGNPDIGAYEKQ